MTAIIPERPVLDMAALRADLAAVLAAHGIPGADVDVREIVQGGAYAGVTVSAYAYDRPAHLPPASECARQSRSPLAELADRINPARPALHVVKGDTR